MNTAFQYFMVIAEEKSISAASRRLFLSPQNLNNYVHRLETEYGTLFIRKPQFRLTPIGTALYHTLQQIMVLENSLDSQIQTLKTDGYGYLRVGIHSTRGRMLLPYIIPAFRKRCPDVFLAFIDDSNVNLEKLLTKGELDIFLGIDLERDSDFTYIPLQKEPIFFVASTDMLLANGILPDAAMIHSSELERFPFLVSPSSSTFRKKIHLYCKSVGIYLREAVCISDFELQLMLAAKGQGACFCPQMLFGTINTLNKSADEGSILHALKVEKLTMSSELQLVTHRLAHPSKALTEFIRVFQEEFPDKYYRNITFTSLDSSPLSRS